MGFPVAFTSHTISTKSVDRGASPDQYRELLPQLRSVLKELQPALVHAGPIQSAGYLAALADFHPMLLMSWGSDLLMQAERNSEWKQATEFALQKADAFFCDCDTVRNKANQLPRVFRFAGCAIPLGSEAGCVFTSGAIAPGDRFTRRAGTTTFIYTRSYDPLYGTDVLLDAFRRAHSANPSLRLLLVGNGSQDQSIRNFVQTHD